MSTTRIGIQTLLRKEITRIIRIWSQTILPPAITMTLYFVIFGNLIGARIGEMGGFDYMSFIVPGLVMMSVITSSYGNMVSSFFGAKFAKHVEELLISPMPNWAILVGYVSGSLFRGLIVGLVVTLVSLFFTEIKIHNVWIVLSTVVLTSVVFSLGGFINAAFAKKFDDIAIIPTFVLTPLTYLGGVFYSISLLPEFWQNVSKINPVLYMVNTFRYGFLGVSDINVGVAYGIIIAFVLILGFISWYILHKGIGLRS
ncbi:ABC transporter permease [Marinicella litoralis]|uniref:Transport permease protein n=1 Tax=Marinicella litoralis TaxID=644220 RepID=A0A4R6XUI2_9GAMM|nr:ABC transporter permease [Marinicella litoralis]TDR23665.1 ABC-2 type transport system permease protein [Marinicella litoralis]